MCWVGSTFVNRTDLTTYLKVSLSENAFFVKKSTPSNNPGFTEFNNNIRAQEVLHEVDSIEVVNAKLGYTDDKQSWFVSEWHDLEKVGFISFDSAQITSTTDYAEDIPETDEMEFIEQHVPIIRGKVDEVRRVAKEAGLLIADLNMNLFYNPSTRKFLLLDVTSRDSAGLRQP